MNFPGDNLASFAFSAVGFSADQLLSGDRIWLPIAAAFAVTLLVLLFRKLRASGRRDAAETLESLLDSLDDCVVRIDADGRVAGFNPAAGAWFGGRSPELAGRPAEILFPETAAPIPLAETLATGKTIAFSGKFELEKGSLRELSGRTAAVRRHGAVTGALLIFRDETEQLRQKREHADHAAIQKQIVENIPQPVLLFDLDYNIITGNPASLETINEPGKKLAGRKCYQALCGSEQPPEWCPMRRTVETGTPTRIEYAGHGRQYIVTTQPIFDGSGKLTCVLETALDISGQKEQERQLATRNLLLNRAADLARITYFAGDLCGRLKLLGGNLDIGLNADPEKLYQFSDWLIPEDRPEFEARHHAFVTGENETIEMVCRSAASGRIRHFRLAVIRDRDARNSSSIGVLQDITSEVSLEAERGELIQSLKNHAEHERIVNACLSQIVREEGFKHNVEAILKIIATELDGDRVYVGFFDGEDGGVRFEWEWLNDGVTSLRTIRDPRFHEQFRKWSGRFRNNELLIIPNIPVSQYAEALHEPGCKTLMCAPILVGGRLYAVLGIGFIRTPRRPSELDENIMRSSARIIALAREHQMQREAIEALDRQNRLILNAMPVPLFLFDNRARLLRGNPAGAEFLAAAPTVEDPHPEESPVREALRTGKPEVRDLRIGERECRVTATPILDLDGRIGHVLESVVDMTGINENKRKLEAAMLAAQAADRAKSYFLATMSHELRTPLNAVIGFSELLRDSALPESERYEALEAIHESGNTLLELINDVLDLSKLEADKMEILPEFLNPAEFLEGIGRIFAGTARAGQLEFRIDLPPELPRLVKFDRKRLRQVLVNLLGNAFKFTSAGGVTLSAGFRPTGGGRGEFRLSVADTGIGMSEKNLEELFLPFKQHHVRDVEGSGLGLAISKRLVEHMNGAIEVESEPGRGTTFTVRLTDVEFQAGEEDAATAPPAANEEKHTSDGRRTALLVDDLELNLRLLGSMLRQFGIDALYAESGARALEILNTELPDLVLTDLWMPEMSGVELAERIAQNPRTARIPVVVVTADAQLSGELRDRFAAMLSKPITPDCLRTMLGQLLPDAVRDGTAPPDQTGRQ